ncbi:hypothetical protein [Pseudorhodobacter sp. E13]|uniref:hypothetical protein n=1 Tax=Pseudorhodobacter sp. E13 TaxID=2487931 RepID=UPI000F8CC4FE|nr:hypothetical protein [Pseudorhodobacter sp. E13]
MGNKQKFGKRKHVGDTFKMIHAFGGLMETLGRQEPAPFFEQIYEPDAKELEDISKKRVLVEDDDKRPPRSWREDRGQKIRCGQISVSILEAEHMLYHLSVGAGKEAASLFSPEDMVRLTPSQIIDRILEASPGMIAPPRNPVLLLKLLAELQGDGAPEIKLANTSLRLSNQGDGRGDNLRVKDDLLRITPGQEFMLDIRFDAPKETQIYVFEFSTTALEDTENGDEVLALPMPYLEPSATGVYVLNCEKKPIRARSAPGTFGFAAITFRPGKDKDAPPLTSLLGEAATAQEWRREELNAVIQVLRWELVQDQPRLSLGILDYVKG